MLREELQYYYTTRVEKNDAMRCDRYPVVYLLPVGFSFFALEKTLAALPDTKPEDGPIVQDVAVVVS